MNGYEYKRLIARYLVSAYQSRGVEVFDEVSVGTTIIGKQRRVDLFVLDRLGNQALALECKYQDSSGTADEKLPYALNDLSALRMPAAIVYAGTGFSDGVLHLLQSSEYAAYCLPGDDLQPVSRRKELNSGTWQLDHILAVTFRWWDLLVIGKRPLSLESIRESASKSEREKNTSAPLVSADKPIPAAE